MLIWVLYILNKKINTCLLINTNKEIDFFNRIILTLTLIKTGFKNKYIFKIRSHKFLLFFKFFFIILTYI